MRPNLGPRKCLCFISIKEVLTIASLVDYEVCKKAMTVTVQLFRKAEFFALGLYKQSYEMKKYEAKAGGLGRQTFVFCLVF